MIPKKVSFTRLLWKNLIVAYDNQQNLIERITEIKTLVFLIIVLTFCTHCNDGSPPSNTDADGEQQINDNHTSQHQTTKIAQERNVKDLIAPEESETLKVYIDPETGEFITPPEGTVSATEKLEPAAAFSTSHEGLEEVESPVPDGGVMIDLKARFRSPLTATKDSNGKIKIEHHNTEKKE